MASEKKEAAKNGEIAIDETKLPWHPSKKNTSHPTDRSQLIEDAQVTDEELERGVKVYFAGKSKAIPVTHANATVMFCEQLYVNAKLISLDSASKTKKTNPEEINTWQKLRNPLSLM